ncbi:phytoene/squalene synthase family protein [Pseudonocardiaceae bacterium YIM PH 21723]|nr:phytoene/squalene synthase family protein [Pseudonocardiaceae bacterium YIM PH 21723]
MRELTSAGIHDPALRAAYLRCRELHAHHGRSYFLATRLLPAASRPAVHALYGFARLADDAVDQGGEPEAKALALKELATQLDRALEGGPVSEPAVRAVADTVRRYEIPVGYFAEFLDSMRADLTVTHYADFTELSRYTRGSAEVIGLQLTRVFGTVAPLSEAEPYAAALGTAFQLTNFLRDVGEDLDRGRVYLPADELNAFEVNEIRLRAARSTGTPDPRVQRALGHLVARNQAIYRRAEPGIALLHPAARRCVRAAFELYRSILDEIVRADYDILNRRVVVGTPRRLGIAAAALLG